MAYLEVSAFKKLRAFFWALQKSGFNLNKLPAKDNEGMPVDKVYCLNLLHSFPDFQGEQFKDDNTIVKYLSQPGNIKQILDQFTPEQQIELTKVFEEKPIAVEAVSEQPGGQETPAEQGVPTQAPGGETVGTMLGGIPSANIQPAQRRVIRNIPQTKPPKEELKVPGLKNTPETGLDYEGKPYESDAFYMAGQEKEAAKASKGAKASETKTAGQTGRRFQAPKIPMGAVRGFGSKAGVFFQRNAGKFLTVGRIGTLVSTGIGAFAGSAFGGVGMFAGAGAGAMLPSFIKSGGAGRFLGRIGNGAINAGVGISNQVSRGSFVKGGSKKIVFLFLGGFLLMAFGTAFLGTGTPGGGTGNVGIGSTTPSVSIASPSPLQPGVRPVAPSVDPARLKDSLISQFGITMNGFDIQHLQWAWEKFWNVSNTHFNRLVRGSVIEVAVGRISSQESCPGRGVSVYLGQYSEILFKYALIHELGHVIHNCRGSESFAADHLNALNREGGVTYYANNTENPTSGCPRSLRVSEDYAETIAVYLNPSANVQIARCTPAGLRYPDLRTDFPLHYNVARSILGDY